MYAHTYNLIIIHRVLSIIIFAEAMGAPKRRAPSVKLIRVVRSAVDFQANKRWEISNPRISKNMSVRSARSRKDKVQILLNFKWHDSDRSCR